MKTAILGIAAFYHDSAACVLVDGRIIAAAQEERFTRRKFDNCFPKRSISYCLAEAGIEMGEVDYVAFYEKPMRKLDRLVKTHLAASPFSAKAFKRFVDSWVPDRLDWQELLRGNLGSAFDGEVLFCHHHLSHAASSFYVSGFNHAAILTVDGVGEWTTTCIGVGRAEEVRVLKEIRFPHSLGLLYSAFTYYVGFKVNSGEYKVMGLAPYGLPRYVSFIRENILIQEHDGSYKLNLDYFDFWRGSVMTNTKFHRLFGGPPRAENEQLQERHIDIAASIQLVIEEAMLGLVKEAYRVTKESNLCIAGGVGLNCVANSHILRNGPFQNVFVPPAPGDAGGALGAAMLAWHRYLDKPNTLSGKEGRRLTPFLGPTYTDEDIHSFLEYAGERYQRYDQEAKLLNDTADRLAEGKVVGWFQGRMEFGPRALGARSILADPRDPQMQRILNQKVKFRESFRPFAPAVLAERVQDYFLFDRESPYMQFVAKVSESVRKNLTALQGAATGLDRLNVVRSQIPAVTHVDYSARLQTVSERDNLLFYRLLKAFEARTGCGLLVNTSLNTRDQPIACTPAEAYHCYASTDMDVLVIGQFMLEKKRPDSVEIVSGEKSWGCCE